MFKGRIIYAHKFVCYIISNKVRKTLFFENFILTDIAPRLSKINFNSYLAIRICWGSTRHLKIFLNRKTNYMHGSIFHQPFKNKAMSEWVTTVMVDKSRCTHTFLVNITKTKKKSNICPMCVSYFSIIIL